MSLGALLAFLDPNPLFFLTFSRFFDRRFWLIFYSVSCRISTFPKIDCFWHRSCPVATCAAEYGIIPTFEIKGVLPINPPSRVRTGQKSNEWRGSKDKSGIIPTVLHWCGEMVRKKTYRLGLSSPMRSSRMIKRLVVFAARSARSMMSDVLFGNSLLIASSNASM